MAATASDRNITKPAPDPFVGTFQKAMGFFSDRDKDRRVTITKTNGIYYFKSYSHTLAFTNSSAVQLRNATMGRITQGQLTFADQNGEPVAVLRCEFCYESFLLIGENLHGRGNRKDF